MLVSGMDIGTDRRAADGQGVVLLCGVAPIKPDKGLGGRPARDLRRVLDAIF
jgi:hypothetical protein